MIFYLFSGSILACFVCGIRNRGKSNFKQTIGRTLHKEFDHSSSMLNFFFLFGAKFTHFSGRCHPSAQGEPMAHL
jgi:hypothetical protein